MLHHIDARELTEWELLESIDPWGQTRDDARAGLLAWVVYATAAKKQGAKELKPSDFTLTYIAQRTAPTQTIDDQIAVIAGINAMFGGIDARVNNG